MSRREARIARRSEKALQQLQKSARLREVVIEDFLPRTSTDVTTENVPRASEDPGSIMQMRMEFQMHESADREGAWSWGENRNWCSPDNDTENSCTVRATMLEMSCLYWHEIHAQTTGRKDRHKKHHAQSWDSLCAEAKDRWLEIDRSEDELFRFRTSGKGRIWGYRTGVVFYVVWWDAEHKIYPVD